MCASQNIAVTNDKVLIDTKSAAKDIYAANKTINVYNYIDYGDATIVVDFSVTPEPSSDKINTFTIKASQINIKNDRMYAGNISYDGTGDPEGDSENLFTLSWGEKELSNIDSPVDYAPVRVDSVTYG